MKSLIGQCSFFIFCCLFNQVVLLLLLFFFYLFSKFSSLVHSLFTMSSHFSSSEQPPSGRSTGSSTENPPGKIF